MNKILFLLLIIFAYFVNSINAHSLDCQGIEKYETFLQSADTITANFVQKINKKNNSSGIFLLKRPKKMRIEYNNGDLDAVITVNGSIITYFNRELDQISHISKDKIPVHFILSNKIKFKDLDVELCNLDVKNNTYYIVFNQKTDFVSGKFTMSFDSKSSELKGISVLHQNGDEVDLIMSNLKINNEIKDSSFAIKDPRL